MLSLDLPLPRHWLLTGSPYKKVLATAATGAAVLGLGYGGFVATTGNGGGAPEGTAHVWVDTNGGSCTNTGSAVAYNDATACGSFDAAWDAMSNGQTARIVNGTYGQQFITGDKTAPGAKLIGESKAGVRIEDTITEECYAAFGAGTLLCPDANYTWIENVTVDTNEEDGPSPGSLIAGQNVTYKNVDIFGWWPDISVGSTVAECTGCDGTNFTWDGGTWGDPAPPPRNCGAEPGGNGEPVWIYFPGATINGITFNPQTVDLEEPEGPCAPDDNAHLEYLRLESAADNVTYSNNTFVPGAASGSGYIFFSVATVDNFKIIGNYFADNNASTWIQAGSCTDSTVIAYNTFDPTGDDGANLGCDATWVGNVGPNFQGAGNCADHIKNVWSGSGSCGTDTFVGATSLGIDPDDGTITSSSPAFNAAETPGASDYCTDSAYVNSIDRYGTERPQDTICDAGSFEVIP